MVNVTFNPLLPGPIGGTTPSTGAFTNLTIPGAAAGSYVKADGSGAGTPSSGSVQVNSIAIAAPNFNSSTPPVDSGNTAVTWKCNNSGSGPLCIAEVPSISAAQAAPRTSTGLAVFITGTSIDCVDGNGVSLSYCYGGNRTDLNNTGGAYDWPSLFVNMDFIKGRATSYCNYAVPGASIYGSSSGLTYWYSSSSNSPTPPCTINGTGYTSEHLAAAAAGSKCYALVGGLPNDTPGLTNATQLAALEAALSNLWYLHHNDGCYVVGMTTAARNSSNQTAITGIAATTSVLTVYTAGALPAVGSAVNVFGLTNTAYDSVGTTYTVASVGSGNFTVAGTFTAISYTADTTGNFILRTQESDATRYWRDQFNDWVRSQEATGCTSSTACGPDKLFDLARFMQNQPLDVVWSYDGTHPTNAMNYKIAQALNNILWGNGNIYPPVNGPGLVLGDNNGNVISPQTAAPLLNGGTYNTVYGEGAGLDLIAQSNVTLTGFNAGGIATASGISAYGSYACYQTSAQNDCYGVQAGINTTTGASNFFAGYFAGFANTTGGNNTYVGSGAGQSAVQLSSTCVGYYACGNGGTSGYVTAIGANTGALGQFGVAIGYIASATGTGGVAVGTSASATATGAVGVGRSAQATAAGAVQLAQGTNSTANTLQYQSVVIADSSGNLYDAALASANVVGTNSSGQVVVATAHNVSLPANCAQSNTSTTAYTCTTTPTFTPAAGDHIQLEALYANTASSTLAVNGASAATIKKWGGSGTLIANDLLAGHWVSATFDGTYWQLEGQLGNANATQLNGTTLSSLATGLLKNTTSTGVPVIATAGTDYLTPSGNSATATALAGTPTLCATGQAPTGVLPNGNATGCAAIPNLAAPGTIGGTTPGIGNFSNVAVGTTNPVTIGGATGSCTGKVATADGTGCVSLPTVPAASSTTPVMDGTAAIGSAATYAKADHVHPTDTSRAPVASPTFTGVVGTTHNVLDDGNGNATFGGRVSAGAPFAFASLSSQTGMLVNDIVTVTDGCTGGGAVALCICTAATSGTCTALGSVSGSQIPTTTVSSGAISQTSPNQYVICTTTCTVTPLTPTAGKQICVRNGPGVSTAITLAALGSGNYYELTSHASWGTANHAVVSGGAATDSICLVGYDANHYAVFSYSGTWTD